MSANTWRTIAVIAIWLATFCVLLFGGFTFASWGEETPKNLGLTKAKRIGLAEREAVKTGKRGPGPPVGGCR